jgi:hypothetical protein
MERLLEILDEGAFITTEEMAELAREVRAVRSEAERYRWLRKYTAHLFMCTPEQLDEQMDKAMYGREK